MPVLDCDVDESIDFSDWTQIAQSHQQLLSDEETEEGTQDELVDDEFSYSKLLERRHAISHVLAWEKSGAEILARSRDASDNAKLLETIRAALSLTSLKDNWDGEGASGYSLQTYKQVKRFLLKHASLSRRLFGKSLPIPDINPADGGSFDTFWKLKDSQLLMNFPANENAPVTYYGTSADGKNTLAGRTTSLQERPDLVAWLIQKVG